jgi:hypothetical protein
MGLWRVHRRRLAFVLTVAVALLWPLQSAIAPVNASPPLTGRWTLAAVN